MLNYVNIGNDFPGSPFGSQTFGSYGAFGGSGAFGSSRGFGNGGFSGNDGTLQLYKKPKIESNNNQVKALHMFHIL